MLKATDIIFKNNFFHNFLILEYVKSQKKIFFMFNFKQKNQSPNYTKNSLKEI